MRLITAAFPDGMADTVSATLASYPEANWTVSPSREGRCEAQLVVETKDSQSVIDKLQSVFTPTDEWRIVVLPVEAAVLPIQNEETAETSPAQSVALREEIYQDVRRGADLNIDFLTLTFLSAVVAALGINADNIAAVIGAMVIAPLLGPLLAFSFGSAIGNPQLMRQSAQTALAGLGAGFLTAFALGATIDVNLESSELLSRTVLGLDSVALALASGAAAALSVLTGISSVLVGVMVAVAILPPSVAVALLLGAGEMSLATRAFALLATNIICVNLASQAVFALKGVRPRTWLERRSATRSTQINLAVWATLLVALIVLIVVLAP